MQPYVSQALVGIRIAEMHREADSARSAGEVRRARRSRMRPGRRARRTGRPERARLGAA